MDARPTANGRGSSTDGNGGGVTGAAAVPNRRRRADRTVNVNIKPGKKPPVSVRLNTDTTAAGVTLPVRVTRPPKSNPRLQQLAPGVTLGEVARACDLKVDHVSRIFNLKRRPKVETANRIATFLGISTPALYAALGVTMVA